MENESRLQERITKLEMIIYGIEQSNLNPYAKNQSLEISKLAADYSKAQCEYTAITPNRDNKYFKYVYADLYSILKTVRPIISKFNLSFYQYSTKDSSGKIELHTRLMHSSGQWIESQVDVEPPKTDLQIERDASVTVSKEKKKPTKNDMQRYGSDRSYQKRYEALSILGIAPAKDKDDDDANNDDYDENSVTNYNSSKITNEQVDDLKKALKEKAALISVILKKLNIRNMDDMKQEDFETVMRFINNYDVKK